MSTHPAAYSLFQQPITTSGYYTTPYDLFRNYANPPAVSNNVAAPAPVQPPATTFRAPAHKNSHHLHSIPPREKSTRTLIVDHMLWVHGRTRLAQARAELGMTDLTGGPSSPNYAHRTRPENYEEEDEVSSEGEDTVAVLRSHNDTSEEALRRRQDLPLARTLRLRAEGLEKVVTSMLGQPPPVLQHLDAHSHQHHQYQETSPRTRTGRHPHILPNGVRLRLALGTIINDFFARQAPHPPYRHTHPPTRATSPSPMTSTSADLPDALLPLAGISGASIDYPDNTPSPELLPLDGSMLPDDAYLATAYSHAYGYGYSSGFQEYSGMYHQYPQPTTSSRKRKREEGYGTTTKRPQPSSKVLSLYAAGCTDTNDASGDENATICPRHLKLGCEICVEATSTSFSSSSSAPPSSSSFGSWLNRSSGTVGVGVGVGVGAGAGRASMTIPTSSSGTSVISGTSSSNGEISGWKEGIGIGAGLLKPDVTEGSVLRRKVILSHHHGSRSSSRFKHQSTDEEEEEHPCTGSGNTKLSKILPRFIKLSALVAGELGREVRGEEPESDEADSSGSEGDERENEGEGEEDRDGDRTPRPGDSDVKREREETPRPGMQPPPLHPTIPVPSTATSTAPNPPLSSSRPRASRTRAAAAHDKMYHNALKPTSEWYFLLAGLLTRAVLEGYLTAGWLGVGGLECLMNIGTVDESDPLYSQFFRSFARRRGRGRGRGRGRAGESDGDEEDSAEDSEDEEEIRDEDDELFEEIEPDEYPTLKEAIKVLFPSLRAGFSSTSSESSAKAKDRRTAEEEYRDEMRSRLGKFYDVSTTPSSAASATSQGLPTSTEGISGEVTTLTAHMERLAKEYPAEPVERAAVRFCEAIAKWRGCPELEMYKTNKRKKHVTASTATSTAPTKFTTSAPMTTTTVTTGGAGGTMMMSMESLVHSNPTSPLLANTTTNTASPNLSDYASGNAPSRVNKRPEIGDYFSTSSFSTSSFASSASSASATLSSNVGSSPFTSTSAASAGGTRGVTQGFGAWITQGASTLSTGSTPTTSTAPPSTLSGSTVIGVKRQRDGADDHGVGAKRVHV